MKSKITAILIMFENLEQEKRNKKLRLLDFLLYYWIKLLVHHINRTNCHEQQLFEIYLTTIIKNLKEMPCVS